MTMESSGYLLVLRLGRRSQESGPHRRQRHGHGERLWRQRPGQRFGGLAGTNGGTVSNSHVAGDVTVTRGEQNGESNVGGLLGNNTGDVSNYCCHGHDHCPASPST